MLPGCPSNVSSNRTTQQAMVFVNDGDKTVMPIANPEALKEHAGRHVLVEGKLEDNMLTVSKVKIMSEASPA